MGNRTAVPVVFADRFFMSETSLNEIASMGGYMWADAASGPDLVEKMKSCADSVRVIVSEYIPLDGAVAEHASGLKAVISYGAGYDHINVASLNRKGVSVCNCRGENAQAVAELTFGLALALLRGINRADRWVRESEWPKAGRGLPPWVTGRELWGKTIGIVGLGQIGSRVARIARGFDMKIVACDPFVHIKDDLKKTTLEEVLSASDILTLHSPLTAATKRMIGREQLALLKPGAVLVNTSRGGVIDEPALFDALRTGRIRGAALDVFSEEPITSDHPLTKFQNVILTPHMGALTEEAGERLSASVARQVRDILAGREPESVIK